MEHAAETLQRGRTAQHLIRIRWVVALALFFLHAILVWSVQFTDELWRPMLFSLGFYVAGNLALRIMFGPSVERARADTITAVAVLGLAADIVMLSLFAYYAPDSFLAISFTLYVLPIIESAVLFNESAMLLVFFAAAALYGYVAEKGVEGEVLIERLGKLAPQGLILALMTVFTWVMRKSVAWHAAELARSKRLTETVVENLPDGILIIDEEMRIIFMNKGGEGILGVRSQEITGLKVRKHLSYPIKNIANLLKIVSADIPAGETADVQLEYPEEKILKVSRKPIFDARGVPFERMLIFRDISRDVFFSKLKSDFISIAAHQLRTPLSSIKWAFDMLREEGLGKLTQEQKPVIEQGFETTNRLVRLVNSLLNVSRIEEGRFGYTFQPAESGVFIAKVIETLRPKAQSRNITVRANVPELLPPIEVDPEKIELVLENLLDNAVSYTQSGGEVSIEAKPEGKFLRITVSDNGVGIPQKQLDLIYSKFFRGDNVIRMQTEGSGLGLYIAKNIVERHGGTINLTSREGEGTTASFTVPFAA